MLQSRDVRHTHSTDPTHDIEVDDTGYKDHPSTTTTTTTANTPSPPATATARSRSSWLSRYRRVVFDAISSRLSPSQNKLFGFTIPSLTSWKGVTFIIFTLIKVCIGIYIVYSHWCPSDGVCVRLGGLPVDAPAPFIEYSDSVNVAEIFGSHTKLEDFKSKYQHVQVFDNYVLGKILVLDGDLQISESDEENYHEMMAHVPLVYLSDKPALDILVIGGGDGGLARQALKWPNVNSITLIDIDKAVPEVVKKHFEKLRPVFDSEKLTIEHSGGAEWAQQRAKKLSGNKEEDDALLFDLIMVDSTDFNSAVQWPGSSLPLFSVEFFDTMRMLLRKGGIIVNNADSPSWNLNVVQMITLNMNEAGFKHVCPFQSFTPTFLSGHYAFVLASNTIHPWKTSVNWEKFTARQMHLHYYSPDLHYASFILPRFFQRAIHQCAGPLRDIPSLPTAEEMTDV